MKARQHAVLTGLLAGLLSGCRPASVAQAPRAAPEPLPAAFTAEMPAHAATPIPLARRQAKPGESLVLEGLVMGVRAPFAEGRAVFVLGDSGTLTPCNKRPGDACPTPWDACCDAPEARREGTATVQLRDSKGAVLKQGLKGVGGLKELCRVRVAGSVDARSTPDALIVNATALRVLSAAAGDEPQRAAPSPDN